MPLTGRCVSAGTLVRNYGATNVAPTQIDQPLLSSKRTPPFPNKQMLVEGTEIWSWVPTGPETKNNCSGESQQQFTAMLGYVMLCYLFLLSPMRAICSVRPIQCSNLKVTYLKMFLRMSAKFATGTLAPAVKTTGASGFHLVEVSETKREFTHSGSFLVTWCLSTGIEIPSSKRFRLKDRTS
jgi:hypothetical protein